MAVGQRFCQALQLLVNVGLLNLLMFETEPAVAAGLGEEVVCSVKEIVRSDGGGERFEVIKASVLSGKGFALLFADEGKKGSAVDSMSESGLCVRV